jgi:peroxiredoxin
MNIFRRLAIAGALLVAIGSASSALAAASFGPAPGTRAPEIGALPDQTGKARRLADLMGAKGVVLVFFRSAGWCPFCQAQLIAMNEGAAEIEGRGYRIVALSYDQPAVTAAFTKRRAITFPMLSDPKSTVIDRWGLRDPQYPVGNMAHGVPRPIIFVIDRKGVIRGSLAEETYQKRPPVSEVVKVLDAIR